MKKLSLKIIAVLVALISLSSGAVQNLTAAASRSEGHNTSSKDGGATGM